MFGGPRGKKQTSEISAKTPSMSLGDFLEVHWLCFLFAVESGGACESKTGGRDTSGHSMR